MTHLLSTQHPSIAGREGTRADRGPDCADGESEEGAWDRFLLAVPLGSFQQSSMWGKVKARERWVSFRSLRREEGRVVSGYQWLERKGRFGRVAYVSKGPVLAHETDDTVRLVLDDVLRQARERHLSALILQPPDLSSISEHALARLGFLKESLMGVITATLVVDLTVGMAEVEAGMRRSTRAEVRHARKRGGRVRTGGISDAAHFFELMAGTCARQGGAPNPSSPEMVREILEIFGSRGCIRLTFAECEGQEVAGLLCLVFGSKIYAWKKGWNGQHPKSFPNALLIQECFEWASANGYREVDFMGLSPRIAGAMIDGLPLPEDSLASRDQFILGFGGRARRLPSSYLWISNPGLRSFVRFLSRRRWGRRLLKRIV